MSGSCRLLRALHVRLGGLGSGTTTHAAAHAVGHVTGNTGCKHVTNMPTVVDLGQVK